MKQKKGKLLIVDDIEVNRLILEDLFKENFHIYHASNGFEAYKKVIDEANTEGFCSILLDLMMPVMNGLQFLEILRSGNYFDIPVVLITSSNTDENALACYQLGVSDIVVKPFNPEIVFKRVNNVVDLYFHQKYLEERLAEQKEILEMQAMRLKRTNQFVIDALSAAVESRSMESGEHVKRMRYLTCIFLQGIQPYYSLTDDEIEQISDASVIHDIGKIAIPDNILLKPGRLTEKEFEIMKTHTVKGCEILESLSRDRNDTFYSYCYYICRHHHERWDGKGYPDGLKEDQISIAAQVTSIADVYDALTSERVYKSAYSHAEAVQMITNNECGVFNPVLMDCFIKVEGQLEKTEESL